MPLEACTSINLFHQHHLVLTQLTSEFSLFNADMSVSAAARPPLAPKNPSPAANVQTPPPQKKPRTSTTNGNPINSAKSSFQQPSPWSAVGSVCKELLKTRPSDPINGAKLPPQQPDPWKAATNNLAKTVEKLNGATDATGAVPMDEDGGDPKSASSGRHSPNPPKAKATEEERREMFKPIARSAFDRSVESNEQRRRAQRENRQNKARMMAPPSPLPPLVNAPPAPMDVDASVEQAETAPKPASKPSAKAADSSSVVDTVVQKKQTGFFSDLMAAADVSHTMTKELRQSKDQDDKEGSKTPWKRSNLEVLDLDDEFGTMDDDNISVGSITSKLDNLQNDMNKTIHDGVATLGEVEGPHFGPNCVEGIL